MEKQSVEKILRGIERLRVGMEIEFMWVYRNGNTIIRKGRILDIRNCAQVKDPCRPDCTRRVVDLAEEPTPGLCLDPKHIKCLYILNDVKINKVGEV